MDPAQYLKGFLMSQPFTLEQIYGQNLKEGARRLQAIFGTANQDAVSGKLTGAAKLKYDKVNLKDRDKFQEFCTRYVESLIKCDPFQPVSGSPLNRARKLDALDLPSTTIVVIKRYLRATPIPEKLVLNYRLNQIVLAERFEKDAKMKEYCQEIVSKRIEAMAFLYQFGGARQADIKLQAEELLSFEIRWNCHTPVPDRSCISLLKDWAKKGERQEIVVSRLFRRLVLTPLIQQTDPNREFLTQVLFLQRSDIVLEEAESFSFYMAACIMEYAFDQLFQKNGASRTPFASKYALLCLDPAIQTKLTIAILTIMGDYPKKTVSDALTGDQRHLETAKALIEELFKEYAERPPAHHFAFSLLLLAHLSKQIPFQLDEKIALFEGLYALNPQGREAICDFFMRKEERAKHAAILTLVNERKQQFDLNLAEKVRLYLFLLRVETAPVSPEKLDVTNWPRELVSIMLESQFVDPCLIELCSACTSYKSDWCQALLPLLRIYSPFLLKVQSSADYQEAVARLLQARASLDSQRCQPELYNLLLSWILACHLEQLQQTSLAEKRAWLHAFLAMQSHQKRVELVHRLAAPHYVWPKRDFQPLNQAWMISFTPDDIAQLMVSQALDNKNLRLRPCPLNLPIETYPLTFSGTYQLLQAIENRTRVAIPKDIVFRSLEELFFPNKLKELYEKWNQLSHKIRTYRTHLFYPEEVINELTDCERDILKLGMGEEIIALGEWGIETGNIFWYLGSLLNQSLLPTGVHIFYQRLFVHQMKGEDAVIAKRKHWIDIHRCELTSLGDSTCRAIMVEDREDEHALYLTIRVMHSRMKLETRSVKVALPKVLPYSNKQMLADPRFAALAVDLCQLICDERQTVPLYNLTDNHRDNLKLLDWVLQAAPEYAERFAAFREEDQSHARMLCLLLYDLIELKFETREAFLELAQPQPVILPQNRTAFARKGHLWHFESGLSLLPLEGTPSQPLSTCYLVLFEQYRGAILLLRQDFAKTHNCWHEGLFELDLQGIQRVEKHAVDAAVVFCQDACVASYDEVSEVTPEEPIAYHQVRLTIQKCPHIYVEERFFEPLAQEEFVVRISWLLALLKSEWYSLK